MTLGATSSKVSTVTENFVEVKHTYFGTPNDDGLRVKSVDVWYAVRPSPPAYTVVDHTDASIDKGTDPDIKTGWSVHKAGLPGLYIFDRDDINGLRELLDGLEQEFDRRDMESLMDTFKESDDDD